MGVLTCRFKPFSIQLAIRHVCQFPHSPPLHFSLFSQRSPWDGVTVWQSLKCQLEMRLLTYATVRYW